MKTMSKSKISALAAGQDNIGRLHVNRMGFGAMRLTGPGIWGEPKNHDNAIKVLQRAVELDVNFIDTADAYGPEVSENLIREALYPYEGLIIATKGGQLRDGPGDWHPDGRPEHLKQACEASLKRLGLERICLYQLHRVDPRVPFMDSLQALIDLQQAGKIRYIGLSNVSLQQLKQACAVTDIISVQNLYNVTNRRASDPIVDFCSEHGIAFLPYFPIGGGWQNITGDILERIAGKHQATPRQIALAWLLHRSPTIVPIPGTSSIEHLEENIAATGIQLDTHDMTELDKLSD